MRLDLWALVVGAFALLVFSTILFLAAGYKRCPSGMERLNAEEVVKKETERLAKLVLTSEHLFSKLYPYFFASIISTP